LLSTTVEGKVPVSVKVCPDPQTPPVNGMERVEVEEGICKEGDTVGKGLHVPVIPRLTLSPDTGVLNVSDAVDGIRGDPTVDDTAGMERLAVGGV